jgi:hypothetical protein
MNELHSLFKQRFPTEVLGKQRFPTEVLGKTKFKELKLWNIKKAYRETCLCRMCELFHLHVIALHVIASILSALLDTADGEASVDNAVDVGAADGHAADHLAGSANACSECSDHVGTGETDESGGGGGAPDAAELERIAALKVLNAFCSHDSKSAMVDLMVCGGCLKTAKPGCMSGACSECGFKKLWRNVRKDLVDGQGKLMMGVDPAWQATVRWETLKSGTKEPSNGSNEHENDTL